MARQVIVVGMAKTGTMHIALLFKELFAANNMEGIAQHQCPLTHLSPGINFLEAHWGRSKDMYALSQKYSYLRFIIMYRDVAETISSLHNFYLDKKNRTLHMDFSPEQLAEYYWFNTYESLLKQLPLMSTKPFFMETKDYFAGKHNKTLLKMFNIPINEQNLKIINNRFTIPANRSILKIPFIVPDEMIVRGEEIKQQLIQKCKFNISWVDEL